uniref:Uncharacterized protein n=1 Tax=Molossus molossus TaxID=27622 RepID=A0A7J8BN73_MOLMO|nr:hypothetical protein HJG59_010142 [Molossus molossus]
MAGTAEPGVPVSLGTAPPLSSTLGPQVCPQVSCLLLPPGSGQRGLSGTPAPPAPSVPSRCLSSAETRVSPPPSRACPPLAEPPRWSSCSVFFPPVPRCPPLPTGPLPFPALTLLFSGTSR